MSISKIIGLVSCRLLLWFGLYHTAGDVNAAHTSHSPSSADPAGGGKPVKLVYTLRESSWCASWHLTHKREPSRRRWWVNFFLSAQSECTTTSKAAPFKRTCRMKLAERCAPRSANQCIRHNRRAFAEGYDLEYFYSCAVHHNQDLLSRAKNSGTIRSMVVAGRVRGEF